MKNHPPLSILRRRQVVDRTGLSYSTIVRRMSEGDFPAAFKLGATNAIGWSATDVDRWIAEQIQKKTIVPIDVPTALGALTAEVARLSPDLMVQLEGMEHPMRLVDALDWVKADVARDLENAHLVQVAADCRAKESKE